MKGTDGRLWFLFIPFGGEPSIKEAVDRCMDNGNGDFIERARIYQTSWSVLLFSYGNYKVIGDVGNSKFDQAQSDVDNEQTNTEDD